MLSPCNEILQNHAILNNQQTTPENIIPNFGAIQPLLSIQISEIDEKTGSFGLNVLFDIAQNHRLLGEAQK
jgi:hypothetical protein